MIIELNSVFIFLAEKHRGFAFIEFELAEVITFGFDYFISFIAIRFSIQLINTRTKCNLLEIFLYCSNQRSNGNFVFFFLNTILFTRMLQRPLTTW